MKTVTKIKNKQKRLYNQIAQIEAEGYKVSDSTKRAIANLTKTQTGADKQKFTQRDLRRAQSWRVNSLRRNATREIVINQFRDSHANEITVDKDKALRIPAKYGESDTMAYARYLNRNVPRAVHTGGALASALDVANMAIPDALHTHDKDGLVKASEFHVNLNKLHKLEKDPNFNANVVNKHLYNVARNKNISPEGVAAANARSHTQRLGTYKLDDLQVAALDRLINESWVWDHYFTNAKYSSEQAKEQIKTDVRSAENILMAEVDEDNPVESDDKKSWTDRLMVIINNEDGKAFEEFVLELITASKTPIPVDDD